jgi:hypothetical protein
VFVGVDVGVSVIKHGSIVGVGELVTLGVGVCVLVTDGVGVLVGVGGTMFRK